ncbi:hypothetical protein [Austwickia chelonae]|uniref:hypothetical protein n=1 Tax=Austwickia chelonae TaxID=100225 RepID=UPI0013C2F60E|nr:hypothetical protein [Austwickia chelonae]
MANPHRRPGASAPVEPLPWWALGRRAAYALRMARAFGATRRYDINGRSFLGPTPWAELPGLGFWLLLTYFGQVYTYRHGGCMATILTPWRGIALAWVALGVTTVAALIGPQALIALGCVAVVFGLSIAFGVASAMRGRDQAQYLRDQIRGNSTDVDDDWETAAHYQAADSRIRINGVYLVGHLAAESGTGGISFLWRVTELHLSQGYAVVIDAANPLLYQVYSRNYIPLDGRPGALVAFPQQHATRTAHPRRNHMPTPF